MEWLHYLQNLGFVLLLLSLIPLLAYSYRKVQLNNSANKRIKIVEVKPVSFKAQLLLVEVEGKRFLMGLSDKGFTLLTEIKDGSSANPSFTNH